MIQVSYLFCAIAVDQRVYLQTLNDSSPVLVDVSWRQACIIAFQLVDPHSRARADSPWSASSRSSKDQLVCLVNRRRNESAKADGLLSLAFL